MRLLLLFFVIAASAPLLTAACPSYSSIFSFGDSLADTGNLFYSSSDPSNHCFFPPYGQTYFHHPSGRCSDGRLIIDFIGMLACVLTCHFLLRLLAYVSLSVTFMRLTVFNFNGFLQLNC